MKVEDVMTSDPHYLQADATLQDAARMMRECNCGMLPIAGHGDQQTRLMGIITDHDIVIRGLAEGHGADSKAADCMTDKVLYCFRDDDLNEVARNMNGQHVQRLVVLDSASSKQLCGVISLSDIAAHSDAALQGVISDCSRPYESMH